jgi:hypothetical protein
VKKSFLLLIFLTISVIFVTAQMDFSYPELISQDSIELFTVHNGQLVIVKKGKKKNFFLSVNNKTDTLKIKKY